jgi:hypothetical protein
MARPEGKEAGKGNFKGNKDAGYSSSFFSIKNGQLPTRRLPILF